MFLSTTLSLTYNYDIVSFLLKNKGLNISLKLELFILEILTPAYKLLLWLPNCH